MIFFPRTHTFFLLSYQSSPNPPSLIHYNNYYYSLIQTNTTTRYLSITSFIIGISAITLSDRISPDPRTEIGGTFVVC